MQRSASRSRWSKRPNDPKSARRGFGGRSCVSGCFGQGELFGGVLIGSLIVLGLLAAELHRAVELTQQDLRQQRQLLGLL